jgi:hypothetical protein
LCPKDPLDPSSKPSYVGLDLPPIAVWGATLSRCVAEGGTGEPENALAAVERLYHAKGGRDAVVIGIGGGEGASARHVQTHRRACGGVLVAVVDGSTRSSSVDREGHGGEIE